MFPDIDTSDTSVYVPNRKPKNPWFGVLWPLAIAAMISGWLWVYQPPNLHVFDSGSCAANPDGPERALTPIQQAIWAKIKREANDPNKVSIVEWGQPRKPAAGFENSFDSRIEVRVRDTDRNGALHVTSQKAYIHDGQVVFADWSIYHDQEVVGGYQPSSPGLPTPNVVKKHLDRITRQVMEDPDCDPREVPKGAQLYVVDYEEQMKRIEDTRNKPKPNRWGIGKGAPKRSDP